MNVEATALRPFFWAAIGAAIIVALVGLLGMHAASARGIERTLKARVEQALAAAGAGAISVEMNGQQARLIGAAPNDAARQAAIDAAFKAAGPGGAWAGGVTGVDAQDLIVGAPVSPYTWRAIRRGNAVTLVGYAPTPRVQRRLLAAARDAFRGSEITDQTQIAPGAPNADWADVAEGAIAQLAKLRQGEARLLDDRLVVIGDGGAGAVDEVSAHYRAPLPAPYRARVEVNITGEGLNFADLGDLDLTDAGAEACQTAFGRMMERNVINFQTGSAAIDQSSARLLDQLASIALRCDAFRIEIAGHTDNVGDRAANMALSRARAEAVAAYLSEQGVARDRISPIGYGPDRPRQSNATPVGQAANRRIEFRVSE